MGVLCTYETNIPFEKVLRNSRTAKNILLKAIAKKYPTFNTYGSGVDFVKSVGGNTVVQIKEGKHAWGSEYFSDTFPNAPHAILQIISKTIGTTSSAFRKTFS